MNKLYLIVPLVLTLGFTGIYLNHRKEAAAKAEQVRIAAEATAAEAAAQKAEAERQAREDADRRTAERLTEEKRKEDERRAKWEEVGRQIAEATAQYTTQAAKNQAEVDRLERELASLREQKIQAKQANLDLDLQVERARVAKRNAELEIQRLVEMTARRAGTTLGPVAATP